MADAEGRDPLGLMEGVPSKTGPSRCVALVCDKLKVSNLKSHSQNPELFLGGKRPNEEGLAPDQKEPWGCAELASSQPLRDAAFCRALLLSCGFAIIAKPLHRLGQERKHFRGWQSVIFHFQC